MAKAGGKDQGLVIAVIVLVTLLVIVSITTVVFWSRSQDRDRQAADALNQLQTARNEQTRMRNENEQLKQMLGFTADAAVTDIQAKFDSDMALFESVPNENRNYGQLPTFLLTALQDRNKRLTDASDTEATLKTQMQDIRTTEQALKQQALADMEKLKTEMAQESQKLSQELNDTRTQFAKQAQSLTEKIGTQTKDIESKTGEIKSLTDNVDALSQKNTDLSKKITEITDETFETADGRISFVNQRLGRAWINRGTRDAVRPQMTFSVYDVDENNLARPKKKGSIEITSVDTNTAEAKIRSDDPANPILPGDFIYTPLWQPGAKLRFALAGFMDIDGNGDSDRALIRDLIRLNGGEIDAEVDDKGQRTGRMSIHTRYLVLGETPSSQTEEGLRGYMNIIREAETLGIEQKPIEEILAFMGYEGTDRTVPLGKKVRPGDFSPRPRYDIPRSTDSDSDRFRERRPPSGVTGSVY